VGPVLMSCSLGLIWFYMVLMWFNRV
jgi:hypothetical protein